MKNKKIPPHLPPPSCNVHLFHRLEKIKLLLYAAIVALLAGIAGSLSALAWLTPDFYSTQSAWQISGRGGVNLAALDPVYVRQMKQKMLTVYDTRLKPGNFLVDEARVAEAVLISSDGWAAAYHSNYITGEEKNWEIIGEQGVMTKVEKAIYDRVLKVVIFKVQGQGFRFVSFADWYNLDRTRDLAVFEKKKNFQTKMGERKYIGDDRSFLISNPQYADVLEVEVESGANVFDLSGNLIGFVSEGGKIIPSLVLDNALTKVLSGKYVGSSAIGVRGMYVTGETINGAAQDTNGFLLTEVSPQVRGLKKGDLVLVIGGREVNQYTLAWDILAASDPVDIMVRRGTEKVTISVKKSLIP